MKDARGKPTNVIRVKANHKNSEADRGSRVSQLTPSRSNVFPDLLLWTSQNTNFGCALSGAFCLRHPTFVRVMVVTMGPYRSVGRSFSYVKSAYIERTNSRI
jgi:hypothetical protein